MASGPMSEAELQQLTRELARLSPYSVKEFYKVTHAACALQSDKLPEPRRMQELVTAWKLLRKWRV
jgi:hypothetical protein